MLAGLLALVLAAEFSPPRPRGFTGDLNQALPEVSGWARREIPIAASSAAMASAQGILNFSQARQVLYVRGSTQILVYVAYWEPGKVSVVDAGSHNPDSCWVRNGCVRTERVYSVPGKIGERELLPYESGQYIVPNGGKQNVAFWHLVNGEPNRYEEQEAGWRNGLLGRLERLHRYCVYSSLSKTMAVSMNAISPADVPGRPPTIWVLKLSTKSYTAGGEPAVNG